MQEVCIDDGLGFIKENEREAIVKEIQEKYWPHIRALGHFLIVLPYTRPTKIGGIILTDSSREEDKHHSTASQVIDIGPCAYKDPKYCGGLVWAQIGDWVMIPRVAGSRISFNRPTKDGKEEEIMLRVVREDDLITVINDPTAWEIRINHTKF